MSQNTVAGYEVDTCIAEIYDAQEHYTDDVDLLRRLIGDRRGLRVLEPFCGSGRILIPLALDGHTLVGFDLAGTMLDRARARLAVLGPEMAARVTLTRADAFATPWPDGFDLVVLGGNCLYELATAQEQAEVIARAARSLVPGGHLFLDNDHMEGPLAPSWRDATLRPAFPTGECADGTRVESQWQVIWCDVDARLARFRRIITVTAPDGNRSVHEYVQQKHAPSYGEMRGWLEHASLRVEACYGSRAGEPYAAQSPRAIFWAIRP